MSIEKPFAAIFNFPSNPIFQLKNFKVVKQVATNRAGTVTSVTCHVCHWRLQSTWNVCVLQNLKLIANTGKVTIKLCIFIVWWNYSISCTQCATNAYFSRMYLAIRTRLQSIFRHYFDKELHWPFSHILLIMHVMCTTVHTFDCFVGVASANHLVLDVGCTGSVFWPRCQSRA